MHLTPGTVFATRFAITQWIADGGFGSVYRATDLHSHAEIALKVLHAQWTEQPNVREHFEREARIAASVNNRHVVKFLDAGIDLPSDRSWLAMEFLQGETLDSLLDREKRLTPFRFAVIVEQIGDALAAAHQAGVIHADLKPENIFLVGGGDATPVMVKVLDFGIARVLRTGMTSDQITTAAGSPLWTSPEQFSGGARLRPNADVWPLGMIAFRALTGKSYLLNAQENVRVLPCLLEIGALPLPPASERARALGVDALLPADFDMWFRHCVVRDQSERFQHGRAAVNALLTLLQPRANIPATRITNDAISAALMAVDSTHGTVHLPSGVLQVVAEMLERRDYKSARVEIEAALARGETNATLWALRGGCDLLVGRYDDAVVAYSEALALGSILRPYLLSRGVAFESLGMDALCRADRRIAASLK